MRIRNLVGNRAFYKRLFAVMMPVLVQNVITNFVSLLDNVMVGQVGTEPMSGVAIVNQLLFVFNMCIFGGLAGAGIFTVQYYGKSDDKGVQDTFRIKLYIALASVIFFIAGFIGWGEELIKLFLHEGGEKLNLENTLQYGLDYLKVMLWQIVPFAVIQIYASTLRETGETMLPMKAGIVAVFVNLIFNYILIFGKLGAPAMGVVGAAIATVLARFVECFIVIFWTHKHKERCHYIEGAYSSLKVPKALVKNVTVKGMPLLLNEILWSSGMAVLNQCYSMRGLEVVSAVNIASTVSELFFCALYAMGTTVSIMVGALLGAGETEQAVDEDRKLIAFSVFICAIIGVVMALLSPYIPRMYNTTDNVKKIAEELMIVTAVLLPMFSFRNACYFTLRSGGKTVITFIFDCVFVWTVAIPTAFILAHFTNMGILSMYIIVNGLDFVKCFIGYMLVKKRTWVINLVSE